MRLTVELSDEQVEQIAERAAQLVIEHQPEQDSWLDVAAAAERLRCPKSRIYALVSAKRIPHHRDGSRLLFKREELDEWVKRGGAKRP